MAYANPVIPGFNPDPSCILHNGTFYLVTSSFLWFPGIPIYASKDPRGPWKHVGNVISRPEQIDLLKCTISPPGHCGGIWAPTIRFHDGLFYVSVCNVHVQYECPDQRKYENVIFTASDPTGPWSDPVHFTLNGFDTSLFFDTSPNGDGSAYVQGTSYGSIGWDDAFVPEILQFKVDLKTGESLSGPPKCIWKGTGVWVPEAPHIFYRDGYFYLLVAEGGTELNHQAAMARSKDLWGPYEGTPNNPLLASPPSHEVTVDPKHPNYITCTGHADLFPAEEGDTEKWWACALAVRSGIYSFPMGRETHVLPVTWKKGEFPVWHGPIKVVMEAEYELIKEEYDGGIRKLKNGEKKLYNFGTGLLGEVPIDLLFLRNPILDNFKFEGRKATLFGTENSLDARDGPITILGRRQTDVEFAVTVSLSFVPNFGSGEEAGLAVYLDCDKFIPFRIQSASSKLSHASTSAVKKGTKRVLRIASGGELCNDASNKYPCFYKELSDDGKVDLRVIGRRMYYEFWFKEESGEWKEAGRAAASRVSGGFTGTIIGMFATGNGQKSQTPAIFENYEYECINTH
ncbi:glycoside hydrolase family 43 protein [Atractiella rhizophila]|nr:glycoside hydrolase family 43 protein [Atractiella rhizophila]